MLSLELEADDGPPLAAARPGQFVTLKLEPGGGAPPLVRSYSLSGPPGRRPLPDQASRSNRTARPADTCAPTVDVGDRIEVAAPRGQFTLDDGARPVVLVSAGVGVTPVLAMLHALHDSRSTRDIWWLHGTRNGAEHAFAEETRSLLATLAHAHSRVWYSRPGPDDRIGTDYDEVGHITPEGIAATGAPTDSEFYLCGPGSVHDCDPCGPRRARRVARARAHRGVRRRGADHARRRPARHSAATPARRSTRAPARSSRSCGPA